MTEHEVLSLHYLAQHELPAVYHLEYEEFKFTLRYAGPAGYFTSKVAEAGLTGPRLKDPKGYIEWEIPEGEPTETRTPEFGERLRGFVQGIGNIAELLSLETGYPGTPGQLVTVTMWAGDNHPRLGLGAKISPAMRRWLGRHDQASAAKAQAAMVELLCRLWPGYEREWAEQECRVVNNENCFYIGAPGNACDLGADGDDWNWRYRDGGLQLFPHNLDDSTQLLTLLVGLTVLWQEARKDLM